MESTNNGTSVVSNGHAKSFVASSTMNGRPAKNGKQPPRAKIIDIRQNKGDLSLYDDIIMGMNPTNPADTKTLPTTLLYDPAGLRLFEEITYLEEYYLTNAEIEVLDRWSKNIAERVADGGILVELGSGNLRKTSILLKALARLNKDVTYYALDLELDELRRTFRALPPALRGVKCFGLHGTYDDGLTWLQSQPDLATKPMTIMWLGSSIGNFSPISAAGFLKGYCDDILKPNDTFLIGLDACKDEERVFTAYNDSQGVTRDFTLNGLKHANNILNADVFQEELWDHVGRWNDEEGCHEAFVTPTEDLTLTGDLEGVTVKAGELVRIERSYKYSESQASTCWSAAGLAEGVRWSSEDGLYNLHLLYKPAFAFPLSPALYAAQPCPSLQEWDTLWTAWDLVTTKMVAEEDVRAKPIKLRNACVFYFGHIPTFLDMHLTRATGAPPTEPSSYPDIFARGVDPDVDNPEHCHAHSEIPDTYPPTAEILGFQGRVRDRLRAIYPLDTQPRALQRSVWLAYEHEAMHLETLLYMLVQSDSTLPPPGVPTPDWEAMASESMQWGTDNPFLPLPYSAPIRVGLDDPEDNSSSGPFGWDNEKPLRLATATAKRVEFASRPITIGEYAQYLEVSSPSTPPTIPASWIVLPSTKSQRFLSRHAVRTLFGPVPLKFALDWPCVASYDELSSFASYAGGRLPTRDELLGVYDYVDREAKEVDKKLSGKIGAVNGHLNMDGVEISPPPEEVFTDLRAANVAFARWHYTPVTGGLAGRGAGGCWEWTSTPLERHKGFEPGQLYPEYTADFFDGKHNVVLGGSWATPSRIAGRRTFVNWYQRAYRYAWNGARLVRDVVEGSEEAEKAGE